MQFLDHKVNLKQGNLSIESIQEIHLALTQQFFFCQCEISPETGIAASDIQELHVVGEIAIKIPSFDSGYYWIDT